MDYPFTKVNEGLERDQNNKNRKKTRKKDLLVQAINDTTSKQMWQQWQQINRRQSEEVKNELKANERRLFKNEK